MRIFDPEQNKHVLLSECRQLNTVVGYTPTLASEEAGWFYVNMASNQSFKHEALSEDIAQKLEVEVVVDTLTERLIDRLFWCRAANEDVSDWTGYNWTLATPEELAEEHPAVSRTLQAALDAGYTLEEIRMSWNALDDLSTEPFELTEVTDDEISVLSEGVEDKNSLKAIFVLGAGASGKSMVAKQMFAGLDMKFINQDKHLTRFFKEADLPLSDIGSDYGLFKKAQALGRKELKHYAKSRLGLVVDMTGWEYKRVESPVNRLRALGYDCYVVMVHTSLETSKKRNAVRKRNVPDSYVATAHQGLWRNFPRYLRLFGKDRAFIVRNEAARTPEDWEKDIGPSLRAAALKILARPLKNKNGIKWRDKQLAKKRVVPHVVEAAANRLPFQGEPLEEALEKPYPWRWSRKPEEEWDDKKFEAWSEIPGNDGQRLSVEFAYKKNQESWAIDMRVDGNQIPPQWGAAKKHNPSVDSPIRVFSTVVTIVNAWVKEVKPDAFHFHTDNEKLSRLYKRLVKVWEKLGYSSRVTDNAGRNTSIFRFARKPTREVAASDDHYDDLTEALDKPYPYKFSKHHPNRYFGMSTVPMKDGSTGEMRLRVDDQGWMEQDLWHFSFHLDMNYEKKADSVDAGEPIRVFSTALAMFDEFMKAEKPDRFYFSAKGKTRVRLYQRFAERYKRSGYVLKKTVVDGKQIYLLHKKGVDPLGGLKTIENAVRDQSPSSDTPARWEESIEESVGGRVVFPRWAFDVEVATGTEDIDKGLMFRESLPENSGMLFMFDQRQERSMYMKNTSIPLDFVFIDDGKVAHIVEGTTPFSQDLISSTTPVTQVLEINAGKVEQHGIEVGDPVRLELSISNVSR